MEKVELADETERVEIERLSLILLVFHPSLAETNNVSLPSPRVSLLPRVMHDRLPIPSHA